MRIAPNSRIARWIARNRGLVEYLREYGVRMNDWITTAEAARLLRIAPRTVLDLARRRRVKGIKIGAAWLWHPSILDTLAVRKRGRPAKDTR